MNTLKNFLLTVCGFVILIVLLTVANPGLEAASYSFEAANYWGHEYEMINDATDPQECARRCEADSRCRVASFHGPRVGRGWANRCVLRDAVGERHTETVDISSWVKP
jgi:hypothetical protein